MILGKFVHWCNVSSLFHEGYEYSKIRELDFRAPLVQNPGTNSRTKTTRFGRTKPMFAGIVHNVLLSET